MREDDAITKSGDSSTNPVPNFYHASANDFKKIPGSPIAYWGSDNIRHSFILGNGLGNIIKFKQGMATCNHVRFLRNWYEVGYSKIGFNCVNPDDLEKSLKKWFPYNKGGNFRKWFGNNEFLVNWENNGAEIKEFTAHLPQGTNVRLKSREYYCLPSITYSALSSGSFGCRLSKCGFLFDTKGSCIFGEDDQLYTFAGLLNSKTSMRFLKILCPTLDYSMVGIKQIPVIPNSFSENSVQTKHCVDLAESDWDSYETSWDFTTLPLLRPDYHGRTLKETYTTLRNHWQETTLEMQRLEEENNRIFIKAYGLEDELTPDVPLSEITLTCNPHYRYRGNKTEEELDALLLADTVKELISYAIGCMFGRYSLDTPGLVLANQGDGMATFREKVPGPNPAFLPDDDNIIPILDDEYFTDDIVTRFREFLKLTFGREGLAENLSFIAKALSGKSSSSPEAVIRNYFLKQFYKDHLKMYKKRPIYWFFSSGKKQGFNALIYMHRYDKSTLAKMRTDYLLELESKLDASVEMLVKDDAKNKTRITNLRSQIDEIKTYDELLNNKALSLIEIDLDDGVVVNYAKFEGLVKKI